MTTKTYTVSRIYRDHDNREILHTGLTLEEAQAICRDPETSSRTATSEEARQLTQECGPWFVGYEEEE